MERLIKFNHLKQLFTLRTLVVLATKEKKKIGLIDQEPRETASEKTKLKPYNLSSGVDRTYHIYMSYLKVEVTYELTMK